MKLRFVISSLMGMTAVCSFVEAPLAEGSGVSDFQSFEQPALNSGGNWGSSGREQLLREWKPPVTTQQQRNTIERALEDITSDPKGQPHVLGPEEIDQLLSGSRRLGVEELRQLDPTDGLTEIPGFGQGTDKSSIQSMIDQLERPTDDTNAFSGSDLTLMPVSPEVKSVTTSRLEKYLDFNAPPKIGALSLSEAAIEDLKRENARRFGLSPDDIEQLKVLPHTEDGRPVVIWTGRYPDDDEQVVGPRADFGGTFSVGPDAGSPGVYVPPTTVGGLTPAANPVVSGRVPASLVASSRTAPVETIAVTNAHSKRCGVPGGLPCMHSATALHTHAGVSCSGVAVAPHWVMTAAHCACDGRGHMVTVGGAALVDGIKPVGPSFTTFTTRTKPYFFGYETPGEDGGFCALYGQWKVQRRKGEVKASSMTERALFKMRDIALFQVEAPLTLPGTTPVASIVAADLFEEVVTVRSAGFGRNNWQQNGGSKTTFKANLTPDACAENGDVTPCFPDTEIALAVANGTDTCSGDSGSALFVATANGGEAVLAITSRAATPTGCGVGGIYPKVADVAVIKWVKALAPDVRILTDLSDLKTSELRSKN